MKFIVVLLILFSVAGCEFQATWCKDGVDCTSKGGKVLSEEALEPNNCSCGLSLEEFSRVFMCEEEYEAVMACVKGIKVQ